MNDHDHIRRLIRVVQKAITDPPKKYSLRQKQADLETLGELRAKLALFDSGRGEQSVQNRDNIKPSAPDRADTGGSAQSPVHADDTDLERLPE